MQSKNIRIAIIGLPSMLKDVLTSSFAREPDVVVSQIEDDIECLDSGFYVDYDLVVTAMEPEKLVWTAGQKMLSENPGLLILNLSRNGDTGDLFGYRLVRESLGEMFPEKILQAVRNGMGRFRYALQ